MTFGRIYAFPTFEQLKDWLREAYLEAT